MKIKSGCCGALAMQWTQEGRKENEIQRIQKGDDGTVAICRW
jgi:hypothetical protein